MVHVLSVNGEVLTQTPTHKQQECSANEFSQGLMTSSPLASLIGFKPLIETV